MLPNRPGPATTRPIKLIAGWDGASAGGRVEVEAIEVPPPQAAPLPGNITAVLPRITPKHQKNFITVGAQLYPEHSRGNAAPRLEIHPASCHALFFLSPRRKTHTLALSRAISPPLWSAAVSLPLSRLQHHSAVTADRAPVGAQLYPEHRRGNAAPQLGTISNPTRIGLCLRQFRHRGKQLPRVRMRRLVQNLVHRTGFNKLPRAHNRHTRGHLHHHRQAMRNENISQPKLLLQLLKQKQHLRPDRNVQRRHRLVRNEQLGPPSQRPREAEAVALSPRKLMRIAHRR